MKDYKKEFEKRTAFIRSVASEAGADGIVFGISGGKDSALVGILCKAACPDTLGIIMPCGSARNFGEDNDDALALAEKFDIATKTINLTEIKQRLVNALEKSGGNLNAAAVNNIAPRLRMTTLYATAANRNSLVAGTGNRSESYMGYFTKWGDGAYDFNPIADLTATEVFEFLRFLRAPENIINKAPSAGLFEGQTDEEEMGITYERIDNYLLYGEATDEDRSLIECMHIRNEHKRNPAYLPEDL